MGTNDNLNVWREDLCFDGKGPEREERIGIGKCLERERGGGFWGTPQGEGPARGRPASTDLTTLLSFSLFVSLSLSLLLCCSFAQT